MPRSATSSSTSRYESPYRRYRRKARTMISAGNRNPMNAELRDRGYGTGTARNSCRHPLRKVPPFANATSLEIAPRQAPAHDNLRMLDHVGTSQPGAGQARGV